MLPGSTGIPKWSICPPAATTASGMTSRRSTMTEAPCTKTRSAPVLAAAAICGARSVTVCSQRSSETSRQPRAARRCSVTARVLSRMLSLKPGSRVWISATSRGTKAATRSKGSSAAAKSAALATAVSGTANGMILTVATIWRGSTTAKAGSVPRVTASSTRLRRSSRSRSKTRRPRASANRLARPVKALATVMLGPAAAAAMRAAASSSRRSPGSSRATTICARPAAAIASRSARDSTRPFFRAVAPSFRLCARIAPSASPTGTSSNFMPHNGAATTSCVLRDAPELRPDRSSG